MTAPTAPATVASRPTPPPFKLPASRRRPGGAVVSLLVHVLLVGLIVRHAADWVPGTGAGTAGPRGGGGGSGASVRYVQLPAAPRAQPPAVARQQPAPTPVTVVPQPLPEPVKLDVPVPDVRPTPITDAVGATTTGTATEPGDGPGTGGGSGAGTGPGIGDDSGSGRGGDERYISPPYARTVLLPAPCARGRFTVTFAVEADGRVSRVTVDPLPKNGGCRREMLDKMMGYQFLPARTRDGQAVASMYQVQLQH